jgi:hypothetical protein
MTPVTNPTLPAGELLEILRWLKPSRIAADRDGRRDARDGWR